MAPCPVAVTPPRASRRAAVARYRGEEPRSRGARAACQRARKVLEDEFAAQLEGTHDVLRTGAVAPHAGDMSVQGNIKPLRSLVEPLQVAMNNGAKRALIPIEDKRSFLDVSADIMEHVDPIFYGDPKTEDSGDEGAGGP
jgi:hypothetical protein